MSNGAFLLLSIAAAGYVGFGLATGDNSRVRWPWLNEVLGYGVSIAAPFAALWLVWRLYCIANTVLTDEALIGPSLGSLPSRLPWGEVVCAEIVRGNIRLGSPKRKAVVAAGMYAAPEEVVAFVASKIKCTMSAPSAGEPH